MSGVDERKEAALDGLIGDALVGLEHRISAVPRAPDFLDVVGRADQIDSELVPDTMVEEAAALAPVVDIRAGGRDLPSVERELDGFLGEVTQAVDAKIGDRRMAPIPPLQAEPPSRRWRGLAVVGGGLLAAALLGWIAIGGAQRFAPSEPEATPQQAVNLGVQTDTTGGSAVVHEERRKHESLQPEVEEIPVEEVAPQALEDEAEPEPTPSKRSKAERDARLSELLEQAQGQWRSGDLAGAEATLKKVVRIGGRSRYAQSAFADLFAIAHQAGGDSGRERLWHSYLKRFPHGRYADDARAGLCRSASQDKRNGCWNKYLRDFPQGSYRSEAARVVGSP